MKILIITATLIEAEKLIEFLKLKKQSEYLYSSETYKTNLLITGVGIPASLFSMFTHNKIGSYDFIINCGIAGSFNDKLQICSVVNVFTDSFGDIGFTTSDGYKNVFESKFNDKFNNFFNKGLIYNTSDYPAFFRDLQKTKSVTVNIPESKSYPDTDMETMEGAAFMLVCKHFKKNFIQIRGVSNIIGKTKRQDWNFEDTINNYSKIISEFVSNFATS
ncbi:MAG: hypothetical protein PHH30_06000 [Bacteroidales bacterium]|nr:hypothetical protein [Bacteroidales bacterium]